MNSIFSTSYINNTIFSSKINKSEMKKINITPLREIIPEHYKYVSLKRLMGIYKGKDYKYKNLEIVCKMNYMSMKKIVKIRLNIKENKGKYYNIYLPNEMVSVTPSLYHKINDIIFFINLQYCEFNFKKELGIELYIDNISSRLKNIYWSYGNKSVHLAKSVSKFVKSEKKKEKKEKKRIKKEKEELDYKEIKKHTMSIEDLKEINTISEDSVVESKDTLDTIDGIDNVYGIVNELDGLIKNIHTTMKKYE